MWMDKRAEFCDATSCILTTAAGATVIGNIIDLQAASTTNTLGDIGTGDPVFLVIQVDSNFAGGSSTFALMSDSTSNLTTSPTTHYTSAATAAATLVVGSATLGTSPYTIVVRLQPEVTVERYLGIKMTATGANVTAGTISIFLTRDATRWTPYADALPS